MEEILGKHALCYGEILHAQPTSAISRSIASRLMSTAHRIDGTAQIVLISIWRSSEDT